MHYATHCVSPCLALLGKHAEHVVCHGSGPHRRGAHPEIRQPVRDRDRDVQAARLRRVRRGDAQPVRHGAAVPRELRRLRLEEVVRVAAGRKRRAGDSHEEHAAKPLTEAEIPARVRSPTTRGCCRSRSARFTQPAAIQDADHLSFLQGGGHGGSHPHLVAQLPDGLRRSSSPRCRTPRRR